MTSLKICLQSLSLMIFCACSTMAATDDSNLKSLPVAARQALAQWNFKFKIFAQDDFPPEVLKLFKATKENEKPMLLSLDLNNDTIDDYVFLGEAGKQQYIVALVSNKKEFKPVVVETWSDPEFKKSPIPGGKNLGVPVYLAIPAASDKAAIQLKKEVKTEIFAVEAYMGVTKDFAIKNFKVVRVDR